jgi:hypothetical protein
MSVCLHLFSLSVYVYNQHDDHTDRVRCESNVMNTVQCPTKTLLPIPLGAISCDLVRGPKKGKPRNWPQSSNHYQEKLRRMPIGITCVSIFGIGKKGKTTCFSPEVSVDLKVILQPDVVPATLPFVLQITEDALCFDHVAFRRWARSRRYPMQLVVPTEPPMVEQINMAGDFTLEGTAVIRFGRGRRCQRQRWDCRTLNNSSS